MDIGRGDTVGPVIPLSVERGLELDLGRANDRLPPRIVDRAHVDGGVRPVSRPGQLLPVHFKLLVLLPREILPELP